MNDINNRGCAIKTLINTSFLEMYNTEQNAKGQYQHCISV